MKILWIKSDFLHPTIGGSQIRTLETLKRLHRRHEIHFAALDLPQPGAGLERAPEYCTKAYAVAHPVPRRSGPRYWAELATGPWTEMPLPMLRYRSRALLRLVEFITRLDKFDAIVCDFLASAANVPDIGNAVLFQHNVESMIWKRHIEHAPSPWHRAYSRGQFERMLCYEAGVCRAAKKIIAVSGSDARAMHTLYGATDVCSIPTGVDVDYFAPPRGTAPSTPARDLVFLGAMDWRPNIDGLQWFTSRVLPLIRRRRPDCSLTLVGRHPGAEIRRLAESDRHIQVTGTVDDVRPFLWESAVSIVPLRIGGGTRLKIYEAMAARIPVVSTSLGAEGLDIRGGENIAIADSPQDFAEQCLALLEDADRGRRMAANAWENIAACYSWEVVSSKFEQLLG
ncbi:MAG TPA: glycosyltransferase [Bryobacteraceae bacterium]|nr:glycosyltransferase [Bryobacteraceae bacterium]